MFGRFGYVFGLLMTLAVLGGCSGGGGSDDNDIKTLRISWPFDRIVVNHYSDTPITIRNRLNKNLTVGQVAGGDPLDAPFSILNDNCSGTTLAPGQSCLFDVRFQPVQQGIFDETFDVPSGDPGQTIAAVEVSGEGVGLNVSINQVETACETSTVTLYAVITDWDDTPLDSIPKSAFTVLENGVPVDFTLSNRVSEPVSAALALDYSGSTKGADVIDDMELAAASFIHQLTLDSGGDEAEIVKFAATIEPPAAAFTDSTTELEEAIVAQYTGAIDQTLLYDTLWRVVDDTADAAVNEHQAVIVLSDGIDEGSNNNLSGVIAHALEKGVPIYAIGLGHVYESILRQIADETGGQYFHAPESSDLQAVYEKIASILSNQYEISFVTQSAGAAAETIEVDVAYNNSSEILNGDDSRNFTICP